MNQQQLLRQFLATPADQQSRFLDAHCSADDALRQWMETEKDKLESIPPEHLFSEFQSAGPSHDPSDGERRSEDTMPAINNHPTLGIGSEAETLDDPQTQIGPYRILETLGEGGMGTVFLAEQKEPVVRKVALKVIKTSVGGRQVIARFHAERQALAMMEHPNIARILDAGATRQGQPYFAMEWVPGKALTQYCDEKQLTIKERLQLFVDVCAGVQHAHQKGIIHRDLKPGNIIVTEVDGKAVPKVIDFGLAKAIDTTKRLSDQTMMTSFGQVLGTLKYMSPEQANMDELDIDTRTDVYALGVILYELLTGKTPLDSETIKGQAVLKVLQLIREKEPPRPSTRFRHTDKTQVAAITATRRTDRGRLRRVLRGDLDWVVMKALEKDRHRRYESIGGLADDIRRYLKQEPVSACPPSVAYQLKKLVLRNPLPLALTMVALSALMVFAWFTWRIAYEQNQLRQQRIVTDYVGILNQRFNRETGWIEKNRQALQELSAANRGEISALDLRSEWAATHAAIDLLDMGRHFEDYSFLELAFLPGRNDQLIAADLKGAFILNKCFHLMTRGATGWDKQTFSYWPDLTFERSAGFQDGAASIAISPDGKLFALGTRSGYVILRSMADLSQDLERIRLAANAVDSVGFDNDTQSVYAICDHHLHQLSLQPKLQQIQKVYAGHPAMFSINRREQIIDTSVGKVFDKDLTELSAIDFPEGHYRVTFHPNGLFCSATSNGRLNFYLPGSNHVERDLGPSPGIDGSAFAQNGLLYCAGGDGLATIWNLYNGKQLARLEFSAGGRITPAISPDGNTLLVTGAKDVQEYRLVQSPYFQFRDITPAPIVDTCLMDDHAHVACLCHAVESPQALVAVFELATGNLRNAVKLPLKSKEKVIGICPVAGTSQAQVVISGHRHSTFIRWDFLQPEGPLEQFELDNTEAIKMLFAADPQGILLTDDRQKVRYLDIASKKYSIELENGLLEFLRDTASITVAVQQGDQLIAGLESGELLLQTRGDQSTFRFIKLGNDRLESVAVHPERPLMAIGNVNGEILIVDREDSRVVTTHKIGKGSVSACQWLDEQFLAVGSSAGEVSVWRFADNALSKFVPLIVEDEAVSKLQLQPGTGRLIVQFDKRHGLLHVSWPEFYKSLEDLGLEQ